MTSTRPYERFTFHSRALPEDTDCKVIRFQGTEGVGKLYTFRIQLISRRTLDTSALLSAPCMFRIDRKSASPSFFHGYLTSISQGQHINGWTFYSIHLEPQLAKLKNITQNRIYIDKNVQQILEESFGNCGVLIPQHTFMLNNTYPTHEFSMQYNENVYDYMNFLIEREGFYYYFEQQEEHEHIVFTDSPMTHTYMDDTNTLRYTPTSGLEGGHTDEIIISMTRHQVPLPKEVFVRDFDWKKPNTTIEATAEVDKNGVGSLFFYSEGFSTSAEGARLAQVRADSLRCRATLFHGASSVPTMRSGYIFSLTDHYDESWNTTYFTTDISHEGSQEGYLSSVLGITLERPSDAFYYRNSFTCIRDTLPFRLERKTERRKIPGVIHAFIDASSDSPTPEIDTLGRYKVIFPQDTSGRGSGKASCWVRRAQPSVGTGYGTSFPLDPGVEVIIAFMDGNPDRPFIAGALSNPETGFTDHASTAMFSGISTAGGGGLTFNDTAEKQGFNLDAGSGRSGLFMSAGSADTSFFYTNTATQMATTSGTSFATFGAGITSSFDASLLACSESKWHHITLAILKALGEMASSAVKATEDTPLATLQIAKNDTEFAEKSARKTYLEAVDKHQEAERALQNAQSEEEKAQKEKDRDNAKENEARAKQTSLEAQVKHADAQRDYDNAKSQELSSNISPHGRWEIVATLLKTLECANEFYKVRKKLLGTQDTQYGATLNASGDMNKLQLKVKFTDDRRKQALAFLTASVACRALPTILEAATSEVEVQKLNAAFETTKHNAAVQQRFQDLRAHAHNSGISSDDLYKQAVEDMKLTENTQLSNPTQTVKHYKDLAAQDTYIQTLAQELEQKKVAKRIAHARTGVNTAAPIVAELVAYAVLKKIADANQNEFGGVKIVSESNIATTSQHTYFSTEQGMSILVLPDSGEYINTVAPDTLNDIHDDFLDIDTAHTYLAAETEQLRLVGFKNTHMFGKEYCHIQSAGNITISNQITQNFPAQVAQTLNILDPNSDLCDEIQNIPVSDTYSSISFTNDNNRQQLDILNQGIALNITQETTDDTAYLTVGRIQDDQTAGLHVEKDSLTLARALDDTDANTNELEFTDDSTTLSFQNASTLTLAGTFLNLSTQDDASFLELNEGSATLHCTTLDITTDGTTSMNITKDSITINTDTFTLNAGSGKAFVADKGGYKIGGGTIMVLP